MQNMEKGGGKLLAFNVVSAILIYFTIILVVYYPVKVRMTKINNEDSNKAKISIVTIILVSFLFSWFNKYVSFGKEIREGDRYNYLQDFNGRLTGYSGFDAFMQLAHQLTDNFYYVLYAITFICCVILLFAYKYSEDSTPGSLFILLCTPYVLNSFVALKQVFACTSASIMFAFISKPISIKRDIICVICVILACLFHASGYLLIPIFLILRFYNNINFEITIISIIAIAIFLQPVSIFIAGHTSSIFPNLSSKLNEYFMEGSSHDTDGSTVAFIKGLPYYIATILGLINRRAYRDKDGNYDMYLMILCIGSVTYACSLVSYWLIRLISILYFPVSIAIYKVISLEKKPKYRLLEYIIVVGGLAFFTIRSLALNILNYGGY